MATHLGSLVEVQVVGRPGLDGGLVLSAEGRPATVVALTQMLSGEDRGISCAGWAVSPATISAGGARPRRVGELAQEQEGLRA
ncbi:MAG TPA: hypothetical protein VIN09_10570 [Chloroflexota bacterium]